MLCGDPVQIGSLFGGVELEHGWWALHEAAANLAAWWRASGHCQARPGSLPLVTIKWRTTVRRRRPATGSRREGFIGS